MSPPRNPSRIPHDLLVMLLALLAGAPAVVMVWVLLFTGDFSERARWTITLTCTGVWLAVALSVREKIARPLQTVGNLLSALREGDFSVRGRGAKRSDPLGEVLFEISTLADTLQSQRLDTLEATALLRTIMVEIDVAIFAFDDAGILRLINPSGQMLLASVSERLLGHAAADIGLAGLLEGKTARVLEPGFFPKADACTRWSLRRTSFRERGREHTLVVVADVGRVLRDEERAAWQRLVRVLGHELNNSLAPIKSIADTLGALLSQPGRTRAPDWEDDMRTGLAVIAARAEGLERFMHAYSRLARLPTPTLTPVEVNPLMRRIVALETHFPVQMLAGPPATVQIDLAQIEQALINILKNAVEASQETGGSTYVSWRLHGARIEISIEDEGPGIIGTANLFVPFFTTKENGSGIGLVLARQIAENHNGSLTLENRTDGQRGCVAKLRLPAG